jgi:hypothetical protein
MLLIYNQPPEEMTCYRNHSNWCPCSKHISHPEMSTGDSLQAIKKSTRLLVAKVKVSLYRPGQKFRVTGS